MRDSLADLETETDRNIKKKRKLLVTRAESLTQFLTNFRRIEGDRKPRHGKSCELLILTMPNDLWLFLKQTSQQKGNPFKYANQVVRHCEP